MTDLSKGIIEIEGFEISASTTSNDIEENLKDACAFSVKSKNGRCEIFVFKKVFQVNRQKQMTMGTLIILRIFTSIHLFSVIYPEIQPKLLLFVNMAGDSYGEKFSCTSISTTKSK